MAFSCFTQSVGGIGSAIGNEIGKFLWEKITSYPSYVIYYKKKYKELKEQFDILKSKRDDIQLSVEAAERNNEVIGQEVTLWLNEVSQREEKLNEIEKKINEIDNQLGENNSHRIQQLWNPLLWETLGPLVPLGML
ncbi:hypothetical protein Cni_G23905 [Canna indica]|uniref:Uncharacterized protein n=1 Tax=Canna indica TaxID=4628 RepID=A0AAQ3KUB6_9LILI|nr:hypothetical protein Cni_G23905 [Canna indica]